MSNIEQLRKLVDEVEFSQGAKGQLTQILDEAEAKGSLDENMKTRLLEVLKADMAVDAIEIQSLNAGVVEIDTAVAEAEK